MEEERGHYDGGGGDGGDEHSQALGSPAFSLCWLKNNVTHQKNTHILECYEANNVCMTLIDFL